ncbi:hypothetical protein S40293_11040 [Stachybotrys chartarum IBT 40293]|nr:hypothetical protein S40293_11040 [Stachybotrys chartarum IBT 40293]
MALLLLDPGIRPKATDEEAKIINIFFRGRSSEFFKLPQEDRSISKKLNQGEVADAMDQITTSSIFIDGLLEPDILSVSNIEVNAIEKKRSLIAPKAK